MVGCFPTPFRKTYVINQNSKVNNPKKSRSPHSPRYSTIFGELSTPLANGDARFASEKIASRPRNDNLQKSPIIKIVELSNNDHKGPKKEVEVEQPVVDVRKINENKKKINENGISSPSTSTNERIGKRIEESKVQENIYEETVKLPPKIIPEKKSSFQNQEKSVQTKLKDDSKRLQESLYDDVVIQETSPETLKSDSESIYGTSEKIDSLYEETGIYTKENTIPQEPKAVRPDRDQGTYTKENTIPQEPKTVRPDSGPGIYSKENTIPQEPKAVRPDREPAKLPSEITERQNISTIEKSKPKKRKAPTIGEAAKTTIETTSSNDRQTNDSKLNRDTESTYEESIYSDPISEPETWTEKERPSQSTIASRSIYDRRSGIQPVRYEVDDSIPLPVYPKSEDDKNIIRRAIEKNELLSQIVKSKVIKDAIVDAMYETKFRAKDIIIKQGDKGEHMYISAKGRYQILIKGKPFDEFSDSRVFGELAILHRAPRQATIKALTNGRVWVLDQQVYHQITVGHYIHTQDEILKFLMGSEKLKVVGKPVLQIVASLLKTEVFDAGEQIVRQGDPGHKFFIIRSGTVTITKDGQGVVGVYKEGDCFGELALLKEDKRQATVTADPPHVECLTLTREQFVKHFGEVGSFTEVKRTENRNSVHAPTTEHGDVDIRKLRIVATLGVGGFGRVELVQHEADKSLVFALKYLKKYDVVAQHQEKHVCDERAIQMACRSPFIVRMYRTFKDNKFVFFLMEPCLGGDVWGLLQRQRNKRFDEPQARFISASVVEAFEYLHARNIIYRDLKPENLLIAENGYVKLTDFGFAKKMSDRGKTFTFAGTPEYVAPEIVLNRGHDRSVDYWTLGIFVFEMLRGKTPFRTEDSSHMKTYTKILAGIDNADFTSIPYKARNLIEKLCRPIPANRLGMQNAGIKDIKNHTWFLGFDWEKFKKCQMYSPFKPKLKSSIDTSLIDKFGKDSDTPPDETSGWDEEF